MSREFKRFTIKALSAAGFLLLAGWFLFSFLVPDKYLSILPWMLAIFVLVTLITFAYQFRIAQKDMRRFANSSMIISLLRLILYSAFAFIYLANNAENAAVFVVCLVVCYLMFTFLEVAELSRISKKIKK